MAATNQTNFFARPVACTRNDFVGEVGFEVVVHATFPVDSLGRAAKFTKLRGAKNVSIWDSQTHKKLASIVVGPSNPVQHGYARAPLPQPILLLKGRSYIFTQTVSKGMQDAWSSPAHTVKATHTSKAIHGPLCSITTGRFSRAIDSFPALSDASQEFIGPTFFIASTGVGDPAMRPLACRVHSKAVYCALI